MDASDGRETTTRERARDVERTSELRVVSFCVCSFGSVRARASERRGASIRHGERHAGERATTKPTRERGEGRGGERGTTIDEE